MSRLSYKRSERISDLLMREISSILIRDVKDPRIGMVSITRVEVSDDISMAKIYYRVIGSEKDLSTSAEGLTHASPFIQRLLGKRLVLKHIPHLNFILDRSLDYCFEIDRILKEIKVKEKGEQEE